MTQTVTILGATGSIGLSTADVLMRHQDRFRIDALVARRNVQGMRQLMSRLRPRRVVMTDREAAHALREECRLLDIELADGMDAAVQAAADRRSDIVVAAMVGAAGLPATLAAVEQGKHVCLANKECLVTAGRLFMRAASDAGAHITPVDSEHAAVHQALRGHDRRGLRRIVLTASGGPFRDRPIDSLVDVTPEEAMAHPNWDMGAKISVDSATMMNKALELIEAKWLFDVPAEQLDALIHPQSIVHALVEYQDGSMLAQMAMPDMRSPIAYALQPETRLSSGIPWLDLTANRPLEFRPIDTERFPAMRLVRDVLRGADALAVVFNAANEVANAAFRQRRIRFVDIVPSIEAALDDAPSHSLDSLEAIWSLDRETRRRTEERIADA